MELILVAVFALLALAIGLYAVAVPQGGQRWWGLAAVIVFFVIASRLMSHSHASAILLDLAELSAVALVWLHGTPDADDAARKYLYSIVAGIACTVVAGFLIGNGAEPPGPALQKAVVCLLILGFTLKLGMIPFYFWLPAVAVATPPMTTALIVSIVDIAAFGELAALREASPWVFGEWAPAWMTIALLSMIGGALLALSQTELKRMLAFSTITDLGLLLVGVTIGGASGIEGAWLGALNHALSKVILFGAVGLAEHQTGQVVTLDTRGLAARLPFAGATFIIASLAFIGVPPGIGFAAYWRIYAAATQFGGLALILPLFLVAALDLLCYARAIHRSWLGPADDSVGNVQAYLAPGVLACLAVIVVVLGCIPSSLTAGGARELLAIAQ